MKAPGPSGLEGSPSQSKHSQSRPGQRKPGRGVPLVPTLMVVVAVPVLIGFGMWQLQRSHWKEALLADLAANAQRPVAELGAGPIPDGFQFRQVRLEITCSDAASTARAGQNLHGQVGYSMFLDCMAQGQPLLVNAGWSDRPDGWSGPPARWPQMPVSGTVIETADGNPFYTLVLEEAPPGLQPSAPPSTDTIRNTHLSYAVQWFGFAAILATIYALYVRRWRCEGREDRSNLASKGGQG